MRQGLERRVSAVKFGSGSVRRDTVRRSRRGSAGFGLDWLGGYGNITRGMARTGVVKPNAGS